MNLPISVHYKMDEVDSEPSTQTIATTNRLNLGSVTLYIYTDHFIVRGRRRRLTPTPGSLGLSLYFTLTVKRA